MPGSVSGLVRQVARWPQVEAVERIALLAHTFSSAWAARICFALKVHAPAVELVSTGGGPRNETSNLERFLRRTKGVQGVIMVSVRPSADFVAQLRARNIPLVVLDEEAPGAATIATDNAEGGRLAARQLIRSCRRDLAIVCGRTDLSGGLNAVQRCQGFREVLEQDKDCLRVAVQIEVEQYSRADGVEAFARLGAAGIDGVFCAAGDACASGILSAAKAAGQRVPDDLAIIGYDDADLAQATLPPLTTIRQPVDEMVEAAFNAVTVDRARTLARPGKRIFSPELIVRRSA